ncbi:hypothetical protein AAHA92_01345 [Salvia divinorum]|uniref:F-box protein n=1 Tax=Salvia divinorum TaxID=28513 RepID=A0ABD1IMJ1_SALDI
MEENTSPRRIRQPERYNRVSTLEVEDQDHPSIELRTLCRDLHVQMQSTFSVIDWDCIFMTALAKISLAAPDRVTGKCDVRFNISNLGERSLYHETSVMSIFLDHELLWVSRMGDFYIDIGDDMLFNVTINTMTVSVPASFVPTVLMESRSFHKPLRFKLRYDGMVWEGLAVWYEERTNVYVICDWVEMNFINETTLTGGPSNCSLDTN